MAKVTELRGRLGPLPGEGKAAGRCNPWFELTGGLAWSITDAE